MASFGGKNRISESDLYFGRLLDTHSLCLRSLASSLIFYTLERVALTSPLIYSRGNGDWAWRLHRRVPFASNNYFIENRASALVKNNLADGLADTCLHSTKHLRDNHASGNTTRLHLILHEMLERVALFRFMQSGKRQPNENRDSLLTSQKQPLGLDEGAEAKRKGVASLRAALGP